MAGTGAPCTATGPACQCELTFRPKTQTRAFFRLSAHRNEVRSSHPSHRRFIRRLFALASHGSCTPRSCQPSPGPSQPWTVASRRTCLDGGGPIRRARRAVPLADIAEETSDSMPSSIAGPLTDGVPVARGRARLATAVNVARTPGGGARNQATIRTTPWRHETSPARNGGTACSFVQFDFPMFF